jgi:hypothetical protein
MASASPIETLSSSGSPPTAASQNGHNRTLSDTIDNNFAATVLHSSESRNSGTQHFSSNVPVDEEQLTSPSYHEVTGSTVPRSMQHMEVNSGASLIRPPTTAVLHFSTAVHNHAEQQSNVTPCSGEAGMQHARQSEVNRDSPVLCPHTAMQSNNTRKNLHVAVEWGRQMIEDGSKFTELLTLNTLQHVKA